MVIRRKRGRPPHPDVLTPAEWSIVDALRHGMSNGTIARLKRVSRDAVKFHVTNAVAKLGLADRAALRLWRGVPRDSALNRKEPIVSSQPFVARVGQISREVNDLEQAVVWYRDVLGLPLLGHYGNLALFDMDGIRLFLSHHDDGNDSGRSVVYFRVENIAGAYDDLCARGITFRGAPHMIHRHPDGTEEWMAFFEDMDGGLLALMSQVRA